MRPVIALEREYKAWRHVPLLIVAPNKVISLPGERLARGNTVLKNTVLPRSIIKPVVIKIPTVKLSLMSWVKLLMKCCQR
jgi:hypothetical protein